MLRTFHAIGQGAFYVEKFENGFTMVYDCGGQNKKFIEEKIKETFEPKEQIDLLFISHFHNEHINGLEFLLDYCEIKKVVVPLLHDNMKIQCIIENFKGRHESKFLSTLIDNPKEILKNQEVVFVEHFDINLSANMNQHIASLKIESNYINEWIYIPYNFYNDTLAKDLENKLKSQSIDIKNIVDELKINKQKILNIYKGIVGSESFNANSLIIFSGLEKDLKLQNITFINNHIVTSNKVACLYLGDAEILEDNNMKKLKHYFMNYWDALSVVQIPHHGSYKNYHSDLAWKDSISIISTGFRYSHPSSKVIESIKKQQSNCAIVSYDKHTQVQQYINLEYIVEEQYPEYLV